MSTSKVNHFYLPPHPVYYVVDDEVIDFDCVLREEKVTLRKGVSWTAQGRRSRNYQITSPDQCHILVDATIRKSLYSQEATTVTTATCQTSAIMRATALLYAAHVVVITAHCWLRTAALASLRNDAGLQALSPYLIRWVGEGVVTALKEGAQSEGDPWRCCWTSWAPSSRTIHCLYSLMWVTLQTRYSWANWSILFIQLHQLLPAILSTILHSTLLPSLPPTCARLPLSALPSAYATFYDISVPLTTNYEDTSRCFNIIW